MILEPRYHTPGTSSAKSKIAQVTPQISVDTDSPSTPDGNNVNIDKEVSDLAKNTLSYRAASTLMQDKASFLRYVITESK